MEIYISAEHSSKILFEDVMFTFLLKLDVNGNEIAPEEIR